MKRGFDIIKGVSTQLQHTMLHGWWLRRNDKRLWLMWCERRTAAAAASCVFCSSFRSAASANSNPQWGAAAPNTAGQMCPYTQGIKATCPFHPRVQERADVTRTPIADLALCGCMTAMCVGPVSVGTQAMADLADLMPRQM